MKKIIILLLIVTFLSSFTFAAMIPYRSYCEHMGYTYDSDTGECIFDVKNKCDAQEFHRGICGQEFIKDIECRQKDEVVFTEFEQCCEGLESTISECGYFFCTYTIGQTWCDVSYELIPLGLIGLTLPGLITLIVLILLIAFLIGKFHGRKK